MPILAQADTVIEKGVNAVLQGGKDFGSSSDSVRFGIVVFAFAAVLLAGNYIAFRLLIGAYAARDKEHKERIASLESDNREQRERYDAELRGMWGLVQKAVGEMNAQRSMMQDFGLAKVQRDIPEAPIPPPRSSFLPSPPRRVPRRREDE